MPKNPDGEHRADCKLESFISLSFDINLRRATGDSTGKSIITLSAIKKNRCSFTFINARCSHLIGAGILGIWKDFLIHASTACYFGKLPMQDAMMNCCLSVMLIHLTFFIASSRFSKSASSFKEILLIYVTFK